jgi:hypothetical protein
MPELELNANENIIWVGNAGFEAHADKVIVLQDDYRSGFECQTCLDSNKHTVEGREVSTIRCERCAGSGRALKAGNPNLTVKCSDCEGSGWIICPDCGGKGGTLVLADNQKGKPTTGVIVSVGPEISISRICPLCHGSGKEVNPKSILEVTMFLNCGKCGGVGKVPSWNRGEKVIYPSFSGNAYDLKGYDVKGRLVDVVLVILRDSDILSRMYGSLEQNQVKNAQARYTNA